MSSDPPPAEDLPDPPPADWVIVVRPRKGDVPVPSRVRRLLKWADSLGLQCVCVRVATDDELELAADWLEFELREARRGG